MIFSKVNKVVITVSVGFLLEVFLLLPNYPSLYSSHELLLEGITTDTHIRCFHMNLTTCDIPKEKALFKYSKKPTMIENTNKSFSSRYTCELYQNKILQKYITKEHPELLFKLTLK